MQGGTGCAGDEEIDEGVMTTYYQDSDNDGYGNSMQSVMDCVRPLGYVLAGGDCNDGDPFINPAVLDLCDEKDNNCNGIIDEDSEKTTFFLDEDNDGYGTPSVRIFSCDIIEGYSELSGDCNDNDPNINPDSEEICDGIDNNCSGTIDFNSCGDITIWEDLNQDSEMGLDEQGVEGIVVTLFDAFGSEVHATDVTDSDGIYNLGLLEHGLYQIEFDLSALGENYILRAQGDHIQFQRTQGRYMSFEFEITEDQELPIVSIYEGGHLSGNYTFYETGLPVENGVVHLYSKTDCVTILESTTTDSNGSYDFGRIPIGNYFVEFVAPSSFDFTTQNQTESSIINSYIDSEGGLRGQTAAITIQMSSLVTQVDAVLRDNTATPLALEGTVELEGLWKPDTQSNKLSWNKVQRSDIESIELQKSMTTSDFETINIYDENNDYVYHDDIFKTNQYYYRLKINLQNYKVVYSDIIAISSTLNPRMRLYPNPANNVLYLEGIEQSETKVFLYNVNGQNINEYEVSSHTRGQKIDVSKLENGIYYIEIQSSDKVVIIDKIIIAR